jgi:hypothetical protein
MTAATRGGIGQTTTSTLHVCCTPCPWRACMWLKMLQHGVGTISAMHGVRQAPTDDLMKTPLLERSFAERHSLPKKACTA